MGKRLRIFTDGACRNNGKKNAVAGIGIFFPKENLENVSEEFILKPITNQRAELYAIYKALKIVSKNKLFDKFSKIVIYTDSKYSISCVTNWIYNWKKNNWKIKNGDNVKNLDIIVPINNIIEKNKSKIKFIHVRSHQEDESYRSICNNIVDRLATDAID